MVLSGADVYLNRRTVSRLFYQIYIICIAKWQGIEIYSTLHTKSKRIFASRDVSPLYIWGIGNISWLNCDKNRVIVIYTPTLNLEKKYLPSCQMLNLHLTCIQKFVCLMKWSTGDRPLIIDSLHLYHYIFFYAQSKRTLNS